MKYRYYIVVYNGTKRYLNFLEIMSDNSVEKFIRNLIAVSTYTNNNIIINW